MADQNSQFMAILTAVGEARLANAQALGIAWKITQLGVGDGNGAEPMPDRLQTALLNERRRAPLNQLKVDPNNASIIIAEQVIPEDVGGWWIREIGLYDESGDLVAVANCPPTFKPQLAQGSGRTQVVRLNLLVSSTQSITLKIDPSVVLATRAYCDAKVAEELAKLDHKNSVRAATTANIALNGLQTIDGVALALGDRVLVKDQDAGKNNGVYIAGAGAWARSADADAGIEVTPGMIVPIEQGTTNADSVWQLVTDAPITLGTTSLVFERVSGRTGITVGSFNRVTVGSRGEVLGGSQLIEFDPQQTFPSQVHRKNLLINGNFDIWQRGTGITTTGSGGAYTADRWRANAGPAGSVTVTRQAFILGQTEVPGEPSYFAQVVTSGGADLNFRQRIESVKTLVGGKATASFYAKAASNISIDVRLNQYFGSGGSPSATANVIQTINLTTAWQKFSLTYDLASLAGKTLGSNGDDCIELLFFKSATNMMLSIAQLQLEEGGVATSFEKIEQSVEFARCLRYYEAGTTRWAVNALATTTNGSTFGYFSEDVTFKVLKRVTPTVTKTETVANPHVLNIQINASRDAFTINNGHAYASTGNYIGSNAFSTNWTADAEL